MTVSAFGAIAQGLVCRNKPSRRTEEPVRRNSYDVDDIRARVFRPIGDGTKKGAMQWRDRYLKVAKEYDWAMKKKGERHPLGATAIRVLEALLFLPGLDFKTGRLEPAIATIEKQTRYGGSRPPAAEGAWLSVMGAPYRAHRQCAGRRPRRAAGHERLLFRSACTLRPSAPAPHTAAAQAANRAATPSPCPPLRCQHQAARSRHGDGSYFARCPSPRGGREFSERA
ncbi:hypothetical protein LWE61_16840 [Sphingobium sufflavum]|uniref:hypothetical protein n=1 Tax=Sphingobium sufflavum TaxID=1129547 RepID=UPI001F15B80E|nr:hypothetical protein [Sphingobium sufflavum]MCE7798207.1 hypothetical protein [Sphingobium sufflavum]